MIDTIDLYEFPWQQFELRIYQKLKFDYIGRRHSARNSTLVASGAAIAIQL